MDALNNPMTQTHVLYGNTQMSWNFEDPTRSLFGICWDQLFGALECALDVVGSTPVT